MGLCFVGVVVAFVVVVAVDLSGFVAAFFNSNYVIAVMIILFLLLLLFFFFPLILSYF